MLLVIELTGQVHIGAIDTELTDKGYISPGLGDAVSRRMVAVQPELIRLEGRPLVQHIHQVNVAPLGQLYASIVLLFGEEPRY